MTVLAFWGGIVRFGKFIVKHEVMVIVCQTGIVFLIISVISMFVFQFIGQYELEFVALVIIGISAAVTIISALVAWLTLPAYFKRINSND